jgi:hypothetical protein
MDKRSASKSGKGSSQARWQQNTQLTIRQKSWWVNIEPQARQGGGENRGEDDELHSLY